LAAVRTPATATTHPPSLPDALPISTESETGVPETSSVIVLRPSIERMRARRSGSGDFQPQAGHRARPRWRIVRALYSSERPQDKIGRATSELQSPDHIVCRLLLEKK